MSNSMFKLRPIPSDRAYYKMLIAGAALKSETLELNAAGRGDKQRATARPSTEGGSVMSYDTEDFESFKVDLLEALRHELSGWDLEPKLLREAFMAAVAALGDEDFGGSKA
jgi:hypothetical protein